MGKLIKNELIKLFKKKSIYIALIVVLGFMIFSNFMYKSTNNVMYNSYIYSEQTLNYLQEELDKLDPKKTSDIGMYVDIKSQIELYELMKQYENGSWQQQIINQDLPTYFKEKCMYEYGEEKDLQKAQEAQNKIDEIKQKLDTDDWEYFAQLELQQATEKLANIEEQIKNTDDKKTLLSLNQEKEATLIDKTIAEYRINKGIKYGQDYLNQAIEDYRYAAQDIARLESSEKELSYEEQKRYNESLNLREKSKYIIENNVDLNEMNLRRVLENFFTEYGIFVIAILVMIAGTIVSEEFNKGTIKLLLVKPYSRTKILLSKFITSMLMIIFVVLIMGIMQLFVGGVIFGFDSLSAPVVEYNFNTNSLQEINVLVYFLIQFLAQLPMFILLATLAFALGTIFANSALAITISLLGYIAANIINQLAISYNIKFLEYFVTMNWDLSQYLFGNLPNMEGMTMSFSIITCIVYFLIMVIPTLIIFKKKNIKNI